VAVTLNEDQQGGLVMSTLVTMDATTGLSGA
jgi:hypothetical protein